MQGASAIFYQSPAGSHSLGSVRNSEEVFFDHDSACLPGMILSLRCCCAINELACSACHAGAVHEELGIDVHDAAQMLIQLHSKLAGCLIDIASFNLRGGSWPLMRAKQEAADPGDGVE